MLILDKKMKEIVKDMGKAFQNQCQFNLFLDYGKAIFVSYDNDTIFCLWPTKTHDM